MAIVWCISATSCGDDDEKDIDSVSIVGTWQSTYLEVWNKINGVDDGEGYKGPYSNIKLVFDNTNVTLTDSSAEEGNFDNLNGHYSISGNTLYVTDTETSSIKIVELTATKLVLEYTFTEDEIEGYMKLECTRK